MEFWKMMFEEINRVKNIKEVRNFLIESKDSFLEEVETNECRKWFRWVNTNETPFPCVCTTRNVECIFAEVYYELSKVAEITNFESTCEEAILDFQVIKDDAALIKSWLDQNQKLHTEISKFKNSITITKSQVPYEKLTINVSFPTVIEDFKQIYSTSIERL